MGNLNLCKDHKQEWKQSHYDKHNCDYCKAIGTLRLFQEFYNTTGKAFRKPGTKLEKELVERMEKLGLEIN